MPAVLKLLCVES